RRRSRARAALRPRLPGRRQAAGSACRAPIGLPFHLQTAMTRSSDFVPRRHLHRGHWMTVYCWPPRRHFSLPEPEARLLQATPDTQVLAHCYWQRGRAAHAAIVGLHGLEASSSAHYMLGVADKALRAGFNAILLNQRN